MSTWTGSPGGLPFARRRHRDATCRGDAGFTLLEVLVAFTILALMMTALLRIFSDGFRGMTAADVHATATLHAQATLASVGAEIPLAPGEWSGLYDDGFAWRVRVEPYEEPGLVVPPRAFIPYRVTVAVDGPRSGGVVLSSLRLAAFDGSLTGDDLDVPQ